MEKIRFSSVTKVFNGNRAVDGLSFGVKEGETLVLIGTSGCGKTTTLKMINRLVEPTEGTIELDGEDISGLDPVELRRGVGYVIQSIGLFPHMTVGKNVGVVPELIGWPEEKVRGRVEELLSMVGLDPEVYADRYPVELSGGQNQRVGVARSLAADPPVVLMDEPFGALDPITREQLQNEFLALLEKIKKTIVFVTHDIFEAVKIADRIALMDEGRLVQIGTPREIVEEPAEEFVEEFLGKHRFHLGLLLSKARDIMDKDVEGLGGDTSALPSVEVTASVLDVLNVLKGSEADAVVVRAENEEPVGFVTRDAASSGMLP